MALDRWIALAFLVLCVIYGYTAFFLMDELLPPFMKFNPVWPSSFPKALAILGGLAALTVLLNLEQGHPERRVAEIDWRNLHQYKLGQTLLFVGLMVVYALALHEAGFLISTFSFLIIGSFLLGERHYLRMSVVAAIASGGIWYLVQEVLTIYLRPLPAFLMTS